MINPKLEAKIAYKYKTKIKRLYAQLAREKAKDRKFVIQFLKLVNIILIITIIILILET